MAAAAAAAAGGNGVRSWARPRTPDMHGGGAVGGHERDGGRTGSHGRHALARLPIDGVSYGGGVGGSGGGYMSYSPVGGGGGGGGTPTPPAYTADRGPPGRGGGPPPPHLAGTRGVGGGGAGRHGHDGPPTQSSWDGAAAANWKASQPAHRTGWG